MQIGMFDGGKSFKINKPVRLIELFAGIGSQAKALERLNWNFEHYAISEWEVNAVKSYKAVHFAENNQDYSKDFSKDQLTQKLFDLCISVDGKEPMTYEQINRKSEQWLRDTYNEFKATNNIGSIVTAKGADLKITDIDNYIYIMTYSFPCQDLSKAGKGKGMSKDGGTRSGLLWEVERLLNETDHLPQVLLMENVPDVIGTKNMPDFAEWVMFLEDKGYKCYWQCLNAKNYGVPQNRDRCFMVSVFGDYYYEFPKPKKQVNMLKEWGYDYAKNVGFKNSRKPRFYKSYIPTIRATRYPDEIVLGVKGKERVITPEEIWKFMGFDKEDINAARSVGVTKTQLAKQAGNSIVVNVLEEIFRQMIKE